MLIIPFVIEGFSYSLISPIIWACVRFEVDQKYVGTVNINLYIISII